MKERGFVWKGFLEMISIYESFKNIFVLIINEITWWYVFVFCLDSVENTALINNNCLSTETDFSKKCILYPLAFFDASISDKSKLPVATFIKYFSFLIFYGKL